jgi:hypothetical protein
MALPASYTEATLKTYMLACLGGLGTVLGLTTDSFAEAVNDVLAAYGVDDIADVTDIPKVRALAKVAALRTAQAMAAGWYDFDADGGSFSRSQVAEQLAGLLAAAEGDALLYADGYTIGTGTLTYVSDPYQFGADDDTDTNDDDEDA